MFSTTTRAAIGLLAGVALVACSSDSTAPPTTERSVTPATVAPAVTTAAAAGEPSAATTAPRAADDDDDDDNDDDPAATTIAAGSAPAGAAGDLTVLGLAAIAGAEAETGGVAFGIDDQDDDGTWEVDVRVGDQHVEVTMSADGQTVESTGEDDLDDDYRAGLDQATITLAEAIERATAEVGGTLDDAELDEDDGRYAWDVTVDAPDRDDVDVKIDVATGEIIEVDG